MLYTSQYNHITPEYLDELFPIKINLERASHKVVNYYRYMWNSLLEEVRNESSREQFKLIIKTRQFKIALSGKQFVP